MANVNISQLPAVTTMKGTDEFPIGRDGTTTNKVTYNTLSGSIRSTINGTLDQSLLEDDGYVKFSNGFIIQWGTAEIISSQYDISFPIPFPNRTLNVVAVAKNTTSGQDLCEINSWTKDTVTIVPQYVDVAGGQGYNRTAGTIFWQAYGY
jgi:hypothetical protein